MIDVTECERVVEVDEVEAMEERVGVSARREGVTRREDEEGSTVKVVWEESTGLPVRRGWSSSSPDPEEEATERRAPRSSSKSEMT